MMIGMKRFVLIFLLCLMVSLLFSQSMVIVNAEDSNLITDLVVYDLPNEDAWSIRTNIQANDKLYGDREYLIKDLPSIYAGCDWISSACTSKSYTETPLVTFNVTADVNVLVAFDDRITTNKPSWLTFDWTDTGNNIVDTEASPVTFSIYSKSFKANSTVSLGPNGQYTGCVCYFVIVQAIRK